MRLFLELCVDIEDPAALIVIARDQYRRFGGSIDCDGMEEDEALALCDLSPEQQRAHPRYVSPEQAIPDGAAAVVRLLENSLDGTGASVESSTVRALSDAIMRGRTGRQVALRPARPQVAISRTRRSSRGRRSR
jgi:hypothetical protein